ncbi:MAG: DNA methyltransferase [Chloroflexota bacterium]
MSNLLLNELQVEEPPKITGTYRDKLIALLGSDLDFHNQNNTYKSHNIHAFPAKFPPQLPRKFIHTLTEPHDLVLDPMMGSGTTLLEALLAQRNGIGFDIDPLALKISSVKTAHHSIEKLEPMARILIERARKSIEDEKQTLLEGLTTRWDKKTKEFIDYWFSLQTQIELLALAKEIEQIPDVGERSFFELVFSGIIITKSGGVSLAFDLAHTRPHRAKIVYSNDGTRIVDEPVSEKRREILTKKIKSALGEFEKRFQSSLNDLIISHPNNMFSQGVFGNAENIPLAANAVDLIVTSPPYPSNAIDYMRAHKFSLTWLGYSIDELGDKRKIYIGAEATLDVKYEKLPAYTQQVVKKLMAVDEKKSLVVQRYYSEMTRVLREMYRVLKSGKAAVVVVGSSVIRGIDTEVQNCLADIGRTVGFEVPKVGVRNLDRNRRMLPAGINVNLNSQIQQRMHQEYVIGFYKP